MNIIEEISRKYELTALRKNETVLFYEQSTPVMKFRHYLSLGFNGEVVFCISQKDKFDESNVLKIFDFLCRVQELPKKGCNLFRFGDFAGNEFDTLVLLGNKYHNRFKYDVPAVHEKTIVVFPCHHSEFVEDAPVEEVTYSMHKVVSTLKWDRDISPWVKMWFENSSTGVKTKGKERLMGDIGFVMETIDSLLDDRGSIVLENYRSEIVEMEFDRDGVKVDGKAYDKDAGNLKDFVSRFLKK